MEKLLKCRLLRGLLYDIGSHYEIISFLVAVTTPSLSPDLLRFDDCFKLYLTSTGY